MVGTVLGVLGGVMVAKAVVRRRFHGCGGCGWHGRPRSRIGYRALVRELELSDSQRREVDLIADAVRHAAGRGAARRLRGLDQVIDLLAADTFDRPRAQALVVAQGEALEAARDIIVDGLERLHTSLSPSQRDRLRRHLERRGPSIRV